jgi:hypothetical protein
MRILVYINGRNDRGPLLRLGVAIARDGAGIAFGKLSLGVHDALLESCDRLVIELR